MNSLPGRAALSLCRRTAAGGMKLLAGSPAHPAAGLAASIPAVRVCHSGPSSKSSVSTKKRGYDITRNPQLNKVRALMPLVFFFLSFCLRAPATKGQPHAHRLSREEQPYSASGSHLLPDEIAAALLLSVDYMAVVNSSRGCKLKVWVRFKPAELDNTCCEV